MTSLNARMAQRELLLGSWVTIGHPIIAEVMADAGFDWLAIDMEHSAITLAEAQVLMQATHATSAVPLARVESNNPVQIKRVLDAGAHGVIVPMVNSPDDAERAVSASKYPPTGIRGVGLARAQAYGFGFEEYRDGLQSDITVIVQIEHVDAIEVIDEILATPGVSGSIIGPYDLSGSLGLPGQLDHPSVVEAVSIYEKACAARGKPAGYHVVPPDKHLAEEYVERGYTFVGLSLDTLFLGTTTRELLSAARSSRPGNKRAKR